MKRIAIASALVVSAIAFSATLAASDPKPGTPPPAETDHRSAQAWGDDRAPQLAEGFFDHFRGGEHHRPHRHHWDDENDDEGSASADPNAANTPVPDRGVFNGKARPKVEVQ